MLQWRRGKLHLCSSEAAFVFGGRTGGKAWGGTQDNPAQKPKFLSCGLKTSKKPPSFSSKDHKAPQTAGHFYLSQRGSRHLSAGDLFDWGTGDLRLAEELVSLKQRPPGFDVCPCQVEGRNLQSVFCSVCWRLSGTKTQQKTVLI